MKNLLSITQGQECLIIGILLIWTAAIVGLGIADARAQYRGRMRRMRAEADAKKGQSAN